MEKAPLVQLIGLKKHLRAYKRKPGCRYRMGTAQNFALLLHNDIRTRAISCACGCLHYIGWAATRAQCIYPSSNYRGSSGWWTVPPGRRNLAQFVTRTNFVAPESRSRSDLSTYWDMSNRSISLVAKKVLILRVPTNYTHVRTTFVRYISTLQKILLSCKFFLPAVKFTYNKFLVASLYMIHYRKVPWKTALF